MSKKLRVQVQECRVMLGVYGDADALYRREPAVLMGTCEGIQHVPGLIADLKEAMDARVGGDRPSHDYFWSGSMVEHVAEA